MRQLRSKYRRENGTLQMMYDRLRRAAGFILLFSLTSISAAWSAPHVAQVRDELRRSEAYTLYSRTLVQIDLLSNPRTAHLPISVTAIRPGSLVIEGTVPNAKIKDYILANAQRITGLAIEGALQVGEVYETSLIDPAPRELEADIQATITGFYPELADVVRVTVTGNGMVELNGEVTNYESKLNISRIINSQQGCRAVLNLLRVPADPETGDVKITEDGALTIDANDLPIIPAAPLVDLDPAGDDHPSIRTMRGIQADDAPARATSTLHLVEEARGIIGRDPELGLLELEVDIDREGVVVSGKLETKDQVLSLVDHLSEMPGISHVLVKSRPYSMQRTFPATMRNPKDQAEAKNTSWVQSATEWIPGLGSSDPVSKAKGWRSRETIRRSLYRLCERRIDGLSVSPSTRGLLIEGTIASARDRAFVLKQIDNLPDLRPVPTDVILKIDGN